MEWLGKLTFSSTGHVKIEIDKTQNDKIQNDKIQNDKIQNDKIQNDKMQNDKMYENITRIKNVLVQTAQLI